MRILLLLIAVIGITAALSVTEGSAYKSLIRAIGLLVAVVCTVIYKLLTDKRK